MSLSLTIAQRGINSPFEGLIAIASGQFGIEIPLIKAIISVESAWNPNAVNPADPSYGLMQLNVAFFHGSSGEPILDPAANIETGTQYLATLMSQYGSQGLSAVISAYNAGHPISGNSAYVNDVLTYYNWFKANDPASGGPPSGDGGTTLPTDDSTKMVIILLVIGVLMFSMMRD